MYKHTQRGTLVFILLLLIVLAVTVPMFMSGERSRQYAAVGAIVSVISISALFSTLTVEIGEKSLVWSFTGGALRRSVDLNDMVRATPTRTTLIDGIGVYFGPRGKVYNVALGDAVSL